MNPRVLMGATVVAVFLLALVVPRLAGSDDNPSSNGQPATALTTADGTQNLDFVDKRIRRDDIKGQDISGGNFTLAVLRGADLSGTVLIDADFTDADLDGEIGRLCETLAAHSPTALRMGKEALYTMGEMEYGAAMKYLREMIVLTSRTEDAAEGIRAFFEKRKPVWTGR